jgi:hypothetical protein
MTQRTWVLSGTAILALGALGCATQGPKPTEEMTRASTVIQQADKSGTAQRYAAADLQKAHDELNNAQRADQARKYDEARRYAEAAEVDADVATARGSAGDAQRAAHELQRSNETLQSEANHNATGSTATPSAPETSPLDTTVPSNSATPGTPVPQ